VLVNRGVVTRADADRFILWLAAWFVGTPLLWGIVSITTGWPSPMCAGVFVSDSIPRIVISGLNLAFYAALLWWVWMGKGAEFLSRVAPVLGRGAVFEKQYPPAAVRTVITLIVLFAGIGGAIAWRTMPASPGSACSTSSASS
jgi:hypothetical protein